MNNDRTKRADSQPLQPSSIPVLGVILKRVHDTFPWWLIHVCLLTIWLLVHLPAIYFGTHQLPFHSSYVGDEQSPVTGALQIVQTKNPLAIYDLPSLYYGPLFAVAAIPAVVGDFVLEGIEQKTFSPEWYKNHVLYDWGGILWKTRIIALLVGYLGLVALYKIVTTRTVNPVRSEILALTGVMLLATNFYYFEYSSFFRHWVFIMVPVLWQFYFLIRMHEYPERTNRYFVYQALLAATAFGISYLSLLSQIIFLPLAIRYLRTFDAKLRNGFFVYSAVLVSVCGVLAAWHPYEVIRYFSIFTSDILRTSGASEYSVSGGDTSWSFGYYSELLFTNHFFLFLALGILLWSARTLPSALRSLLVSCGLLAGLYFALVGTHSIHVSRYMLPVIMMLIVAVAILLVNLYPKLRQVQRWLLWLVLGSYVVYHVISVCFWLLMTSAGPFEQTDIARILQEQNEYPETRMLTNSPRLLGWPHTVGSYQQFAEVYDLSERSQFQGYFNSISPSVPLLKLEYSSSSDLSVGEGYDKYVHCSNPVWEGEIEEDHQEVVLTRLWTRDYYWQPRCLIYSLRAE